MPDRCRHHFKAVSKTSTTIHLGPLSGTQGYRVLAVISTRRHRSPPFHGSLPEFDYRAGDTLFWPFVSTIPSRRSPSS